MHRSISITIVSLVLLVVALRYLPNTPIDPWQLIRLRKLVAIFLALLIIQSSSSFAISLLGTRAGISISSFLGGFISSTAVTMAFARQSRTEELALDSGVTIAAAAMILEAAGIVYMGSTQLGTVLIPVWIGTVLTSVFMIWHQRKANARRPVGLPTSFHWKTALQLALGLNLVLAIIALAQRTWGEASRMILSFLGSLFELHSVLFANVNIGGIVVNGSHREQILVITCISAALLSKIALAWVLGSRQFAKRVSQDLGAMLIVSWLLYIIF